MYLLDTKVSPDPNLPTFQRQGRITIGISQVEQSLKIFCSHTIALIKQWLAA